MVIYKDIIRKVRAVGGNPIVLNLPPIDSDKYFAWISSGLCGDSIKGWLGGDTDFIYRWHELYNQQVCALTSKMGVPVIDIRSAFLEKFDYGKLLCIDGIHPNVDGHALICSVIEKTVRTALRIQ
ncbi:MAG: SGNH/GDSL hydrolase family protein [Oscillospiraceae bacterium]